MTLWLTVGGGYFLTICLALMLPHHINGGKKRIQIPVSLKDLTKWAYETLSCLSTKLTQHLDYFIVLRSKFQSLQLN